jgi:hypothetical protein
MLALYRKLLHLYPADYFREYATEMALVFSQAQGDTREKNFVDRWSFYLREISGVLTGALRQHLFGPSDWNGIRRFDMRSEFRFPRSTVFLMCVILAGVELAIHEAMNIVQMKEGFPPVTTAAWLFHALLGLLSAVVLLLVGVAAVWGILFALQRTGMHRLGNVQTWPEQR